MSLQQLKEKAGNLSDQQRHELIGYLLALGRERTADYCDRLTAKIEDNDPSHWVTEENLAAALGLANRS